MSHARSTLTALIALAAISLAVPAGATAQNREMTPEERARLMAEYEARIDAVLDELAAHLENHVRVDELLALARR